MSLIEKAQQTQPAEGAEEEGGLTPNVSPQEQEAYNTAVANAQTILYSDATRDSLMKIMSANQDNPAEALSDGVSYVITAMDQKLGGKVPEDVILPAAMEVLEALAEMVEVSGMIENLTPQDVERAGVLATQKLIDDYGGIEEQDAQGILEGFDKNDMGGMAQEVERLANG